MKFGSILMKVNEPVLKEIDKFLFEIIYFNFKLPSLSRCSRSIFRKHILVSPKLKYIISPSQPILSPDINGY